MLLTRGGGRQGNPPLLSDYREHHTDMDVHFSMQLLDGVMAAALAEGLHKKFKLGSKLAISAPPLGLPHLLAAPCTTRNRACQEAVHRGLSE